MQLDPPAQTGWAPRRLRGVLVWSVYTLLAALALALVIASLALELGSAPAPPPPPMQISQPGGHAMAQ